MATAPDNGPPWAEVQDPLAEVWTPPADLTLREVCELPLPTGDPVLGPIWPGYRIIIAGDGGQGKTSLVMGIIKAAAHGEEFLGWTGVGGTVLVFDVEMGLRSVQIAAKKADLHESDMVRYYRIPDGMELDKGGDPDRLAIGDVQLSWMVGLIEKHQPIMVVIDPLYKAHGGDSNDERQMVDLMRKLDKIRDAHGFALLIPMHVRKPDPKSPDPTLGDVFGSGGLTRGAEVVLGIRKRFPGGSKLGWLKDRDGEYASESHWNLTYSPENGFERDKDDAEKPMTEQIADAFLVGGSGAMSLRQIAQAVDKSERRVHDHLKGMIEDGLVSKAEKPGPRNVKLYVLDHLPQGVDFNG